ncbi:hypothetical protein ASF11_23020 [Acidovorax sp. Leaf76]|nr:hypothetical protein ASF11_23020 [Acidovorax sp. Leaf76]KQO35647.1 hypothetical protein ASF19_23090 [Acidovorax sp. Leaf84]KQS39890.1 hypothetical protein ASG27_22320 [Acidovorax sp. Leaf191]
MDVARYQLLAGAGLAHHQHRRIAARNAVHMVEQLRGPGVLDQQRLRANGRRPARWRLGQGQYAMGGQEA